MNLQSSEYEGVSPSRSTYHRSQYLEERKAMMQQWADFLDSHRSSENVVAFKRLPKTS
jgi:hypothetical protein